MPKKPRARIAATPTTFRLDEETDRLLDGLGEVLGLARVQVIRLAVRDLARARGFDGAAKRPKGR